VIGVSDATLALKVALKLLNVDAESFAAADLNGDGMISMGEVTQILRAALGLAQLPQS
jgi:Ca2+-binding EF-hand superfamily protein